MESLNVFEELLHLLSLVGGFVLILLVVGTVVGVFMGEVRGSWPRRSPKPMARYKR